MECRSTVPAQEDRAYNALEEIRVDVFTIMEANLNLGDLAYYQFSGHTLHLLQNYRQIASGILVGASSYLASDFTEIKEMGNTSDKSEIVKLDLWKNECHFKIYAVYRPPKNNLNFSYLTFSSKTVLVGDFNAHSPLWGYKNLNAAGKEIEDLLNTTCMFIEIMIFTLICTITAHRQHRT